MDIIALPTYYSSEAFPISILEAMSNGCLVLSCPRAAIPDMLTSVGGGKCGLLVEEKSADSIVDAILWAQNNTVEADNLRKKRLRKSQFVTRCLSCSKCIVIFMKKYWDEYD